MRKASFIPLVAVSGFLLLAPPICTPPSVEAQPSGGSSTRPAVTAPVYPTGGAKNGVSEAASLELKKQQLAAKEAALAVKEQELKALAATLEARVKELETAKAGLDRSLDARKKVQSANYQKLLKVYKGLKPQEAVKLLDGLPENEALELLSEMDQKRAAKLLPLIKKERALKWTRQNLAAR